MPEGRRDTSESLPRTCPSKPPRGNVSDTLGRGARSTSDNRTSTRTCKPEEKADSRWETGPVTRGILQSFANKPKERRSTHSRAESCPAHQPVGIRKPSNWGGGLRASRLVLDGEQQFPPARQDGTEDGTEPGWAQHTHVSREQKAEWTEQPRGHTRGPFPMRL